MVLPSQVGSCTPKRGTCFRTTGRMGLPQLTEDNTHTDVVMFHVPEAHSRDGILVQGTSPLEQPPLVTEPPTGSAQARRPERGLACRGGKPDVGLPNVEGHHNDGDQHLHSTSRAHKQTHRDAVY